MGIILRLIGAALMLLGALAATQLGLAPAWMLAAYLVMGLISFGVYGQDKDAGRNGDWRIPERTLHTLDLLCGIAGGLLAQAIFRHKTRKDGFVAMTVLISLLHIAGLASLDLGFWTFPEPLFFD